MYLTIKDNYLEFNGMKGKLEQLILVLAGNYSRNRFMHKLDSRISGIAENSGAADR
jgi:hypothetical protein